MKILKFDEKNGEIVLRLHSVNDLWHISKVISIGDLASAQTTRKIKIGGEDEKARVKKKPAYVAVEVSKVLLEHESLRIQGKVKRGPEDIPLGSAHTLSIDAGDELTLQKVRWAKYQMERVKQAEKSTNAPKLLLLAFDDEEAGFAALTDSGIRKLATLELELAKKQFKVADTREQLGNLVKQLSDFVDRLKPSKVIIASPSFWKDELLKVVKSQELIKQIQTETVSSGGYAGVKELLDRGVLDKVVEESQLQQEYSLIEEVKKRIAKNGLVSYGLNEVRSAVESGAVDVLLVTDEFFEKHKDVEELIESVEKGRGKVVMIGSDNDAGKILDGLSGIAGLLRFKI